jgi:hypothetical protein
MRLEKLAQVVEVQVDIQPELEERIEQLLVEKGYTEVCLT